MIVNCYINLFIIKFTASLKKKAFENWYQKLFVQPYKKKRNRVSFTPHDLALIVFHKLLRTKLLSSASTCSLCMPIVLSDLCCNFRNASLCGYFLFFFGFCFRLLRFVKWASPHLNFIVCCTNISKGFLKWGLLPYALLRH